MYPNFDDDSDEIDYGYSEQIDDDIDEVDILDEDMTPDLDSVELVDENKDKKWIIKDESNRFISNLKDCEIYREYVVDGADEYYEWWFMCDYFYIRAYTQIIAGAPSQQNDFYNVCGQIKERIDKLIFLDSVFANVQQYIDGDFLATDGMFAKLVYERYNFVESYDSDYNDPIEYSGTLGSTSKEDRNAGSIKELFEYYHLYFFLAQTPIQPIYVPPVDSGEPIDEEPIDEEPVDEEPVDEDSYSETLWALEPGYYMSYYANLGFIIPNRYAIDVLIADKVMQYGFLPLVQVSLPLEINWIPEMAGLISTITAFTKGFLASQQEQIVSSAVISKPASSYIVTYYPSRTTHTLASAMESSGGNFSLTNFVKGRTGLNPMLYTAGTHIEDIIGKVARVFTTVWLLPMKDYVGFNREDSVPEPRYDALPDMIYYIRNALRSEYLFSFNKIEVFDAERVEKSNLSPAVDNIMVFDKWIKVRDSMNRYIDSLKVNAFGFGRIFDQMTRNWSVWSLQKGSKLTKHADFFARSGPYENMKIWGYMQKWAEAHFIDESVSGYINTPYSVSDLILGR